MFRSVVVSLILGVWVGLLGIEFGEELGVFVFANEQIDQAADDAVEGFGKAIPTADRPQLYFAQRWPSKLAVVQPSDPSADFRPLLHSSRRRLARTVSKKYIPIYQLYLDLRF